MARYLVEASLGRWLWDGPPPEPDELVDRTRLERRRWRTPAELAEVRIIDPACGDGALIEAALDCLEGWHQARALVGDPDGSG